MSSAETAYLDANVLVYHLFPEESSQAARDKTVTFLEKVEAGKFKLVTSTFTLGEVKAVCKRLLAKSLDREPTPDEFTRVVSEIDTTLSDWGADVYDSERLISPSRTLLITEAEKIIEFSSPIRTNDTRWHMVGFADALAALFASKIPAKYFATFDVAFRGLRWSIEPFILWGI